MLEGIGIEREEVSVKLGVSGCRFYSTRCQGCLESHNFGIFFEQFWMRRGENHTGYNRLSSPDSRADSLNTKGSKTAGCHTFYRNSLPRDSPYHISHTS